MVRLEQVWRERIRWLQSSGLTVAAGSKELGVSVASVYRWKKLLAETLCSGQRQPTRRRRTIPATAAPQTTLPLVAVRLGGEEQSSASARALHRVSADGCGSGSWFESSTSRPAARRRSSVCR